MPLYHRPYDTTGNEYATHGQINRELIMSTSAMEDNYDITNRSRARDREVLTAANRAITTDGYSNSSEQAPSSMGRQRRSTVRSFRSAPRSQSVPVKRPTYSADTTTNIISSSGLKASAPPTPSQYVNYSKHLDLNKSLQNSQYEPIYNYVFDTGDGSRSYTVEPLSLAYDNEDTDIPDEYVPFKPRYREPSPDRDYSQMSVLPYIPKRDPTKNSLQDDLNFNALVAQSASRARKALENINWANYDSAGLVLSVEGEYIPPEQNTALGFRYVSRPIMLKVPAAQRVSYKDSDNAFTKYMTDLRKFRDEIRQRLEEGYSTLNKHSATHYETPAIDYSSTPSYTSSYSRPTRSYRRYVTSGDDESKFGHSLELYPVTSGTSG
ncbi:hypothetical protein MAR_025806 [Mya arenaria]|uniref:Uncharacterized protein n=1 Tax=Mya arenaria TaxID=6604 RepID=A0ABY7ES42_MYAAR|nr:hypothetical protein MAR_025806 [Mya arenaria]